MWYHIGMIHPRLCHAWVQAGLKPLLTSSRWSAQAAQSLPGMPLPETLQSYFEQSSTEFVLVPLVHARLYYSFLPCLPEVQLPLPSSISSASNHSCPYNSWYSPTGTDPSALPRLQRLLADAPLLSRRTFHWMS